MQIPCYFRNREFSLMEQGVIQRNREFIWAGRDDGIEPLSFYSCDDNRNKYHGTGILSRPHRAKIISGWRSARRGPRLRRLDEKHLLHFVAEVVDDLDANAPPFRLRERTRNGGVQLGPCGLVDLRLERALEPVIGIVAHEIGLAHKEAFLVVVVVDDRLTDQHMQPFAIDVLRSLFELEAKYGTELQGLVRR